MEDPLASETCALEENDSQYIYHVAESIPQQISASASSVVMSCYDDNFPVVSRLNLCGLSNSQLETTFVTNLGHFLLQRERGCEALSSREHPKSTRNHETSMVFEFNQDM